MNPYNSLPKKAFWKPSIADVNMLEIADLWTPKFDIRMSDKVVTAGSCFAQHISKAMVANGFTWLDGEPAPKFLPDKLRRQFGYGVFSFRTGNIYTAAALRQWVEAAFGDSELDGEVWEKAGRFYDPLRPALEPEGFSCSREFEILRRVTLNAIRKTLSEVDLFVFTLGLTESWRNRETGLVYAGCPGTVAGEFSSEVHEFHNQRYNSIAADMSAVFDLIKRNNPNVRFLLTVSPVPLTATAAPQHVLLSTVYSKSVLRAVAGDLAHDRSDTDYFPSFEIINSTPFRGAFFQPNQREVSPAGVDFVMNHFFSGLRGGGAVRTATKDAALASLSKPEQDHDIQCEEALLEAFAK